MQRQNVTSSDISSIGYDEENFILEIEFNKWWIYQYSSVPLSEYQGLMSASSQGKYFYANIKNVYSYSKVS